MKEIYICDVHRHENQGPIAMFVAVSSKQLKTKRDGAQFLALRLSDRSGQCDGVMWERFETCIREFEPGDVVKISTRVAQYSGKPQLVIERLRRAHTHEWEPADFAPHTEHDIDALWASLSAFVHSFTDPHLKALMLAFLADEDIRRGLREAPAATRLHHAWLGGLLEHIVSLLGVCDLAARYYPEIHRDLLLTGAMLHDIGKLEELRWGVNFDYTVDGQMLGHIALGIGMIERKLAAMPDFPRHLRLLVEHLVISHHGRYEFGSPKLPMTPEAIMLHQLDDLDAKLHIMRAEFRKSEQDGRAPGELTDRVWALERPILDTRAYLRSRNSQALESPAEPLPAEPLPAQPSPTKDPA
jgi:3'-5' exoribonuclease